MSSASYTTTRLKRIKRNASIEFFAVTALLIGILVPGIIKFNDYLVAISSPASPKSKPPIGYATLPGVVPTKNQAAGTVAPASTISGSAVPSAAGVQSTNASAAAAAAGPAAAVNSQASQAASLKPSDAATGPRTATTDMPGSDNLVGTYSGKRFTGSVTTSGPLYLTDCVIDGSLHVYNGPVVLDHCSVNGWTGITTDNLDPNLSVFTARFTKFTGPLNNDTMRIGPRSKWGDNSRYINTLIEDSIIFSPVTQSQSGAHLDVLQFGGGRNSTFNRVVMRYAATTQLAGATSYINNGTHNINVVFNNVWLEGGPMSYSVGGPMTVNTCVMQRSVAWYGYVYPAPGTVLNNCTDDLGRPIKGT